MFCGQEEMISIRAFLLGEIGRLCIRDTRPNGYRERNLRAIMLCGRSHISGYHLGSASLTAIDKSHELQQTSRTWSTHCGMQEKQLRPGEGALEPSGFKICTSTVSNGRLQDTMNPDQRLRYTSVLEGLYSVPHWEGRGQRRMMRYTSISTSVPVYESDEDIKFIWVT